MKKILLPVLVATVLISFPACGNKKTSPENTGTVPVTETQTVEKYKSQDGKFKIRFPEEPTVSIEKIPTEAGEIDMTLFMYEKSRQEAYMVSYCDYPQEKIQGTGPKEMLNSSKLGVLQNIDARLTDEKDIMLGKFPGIYFKANSTELYMVYKMFMVDNRLFQIAIMKEGTYPDNGDAGEFLDSFELAD
jgi:hypothetical protein